MNANISHGGYDDPLDVSARIAGVVHGGMPAVLRIVLVAVLGAAAHVVEVLSVRVDELDGSAVTVDVDYRPQRTARLDAAEEHALLLAVNTEVHVTSRGDVVEQHSVAFGETLGEGFSPVSGLVGEVWAGVAGQTVTEVHRVVRGEAEADDAAPVVRDLQELDAYLVGRERNKRVLR